jgi:hypothetical protein
MKPPRPYLSYSSYRLWKQSIMMWHRRYIDGIDTTTVAMEFGKRFATALEADEETGDMDVDFGLLGMPSYRKREYEMRATLRATGKENGVIILGKFDGFNPRPPEIGEVKTGATKWTQRMVDTFDQLTWYALIYYLNKKKHATLKLHHYNQHEHTFKTFVTARSFGQLMELAGDAIKVNQEIKEYCHQLQ